MRVWRDLAARPLRQLTPAEAPLRPLPPLPRNYLFGKVIRALAEHLPCAEHTCVCTAYAPAFAAPATCWQHARNRVAPAPSPAAPACRPPVVSRDEPGRPAPARASHITATTRRRCRPHSSLPRRPPSCRRVHAFKRGTG